HLGDVLAQPVAYLATSLVYTVVQLVGLAVHARPLGGGRLADAGDAGEVVAGVAAQGGEVGVLARAQAVLLLHRLGGEAGHVADAAPGHEHGDVVVDELQRVAVAGDDEHVHALCRGAGGQGGDEVVGLEARLGQPGDVQDVEQLVDELHLAAEVLGRDRKSVV